MKIPPRWRGWFCGWLAVGCLASAVAGERVMYVANYGESEVLRYSLSDPADNQVELDASDGLDGPFGSNALAMDLKGRMYVGNFNAHQVLRFPDGVVVADVQDGLDTPDGIATAGALVFIANRGGGNILKLLPNGDVEVFDAGIGTPMSISIGGGRLFVATRSGDIYYYDELDPGQRVWLGRYGPGGNVAIQATTSGRVVFYLDDGELLEIEVSTPDEPNLITSDLGVADEGLALGRGLGANNPAAYVSDFTGRIYKVCLYAGEVEIFADRQLGLNGPSALLMYPARRICGRIWHCDSNCDGQVDFNDIDPFVDALISSSEYNAKYPNCDLICNNDANGDDLVDFDDIEAFVACLID